jgi:hypothetical protein
MIFTSGTFVCARLVYTSELLKIIVVFFLTLQDDNLYIENKLWLSSLYKVVAVKCHVQYTPTL